MDFKTLAISATAAGTILLSGLTFTGTINLADIKNLGWGWTEKLNTAVNETKDMAAKFGLFKTDVTELLNEKIAKINELNARISQLGAEVASGSVNLEDANNEIARLNEELTKANSEVEALKNEYSVKDSEVQTVFATMATDESMDTALALDAQNPDAVVDDAAPAAPEEPEAPAAPQEPQGYAAQQTAIYNALTMKYAGLEDLQVTVTATTITLVEPNIKDHDKYGMIYEADIESAMSINITEVQPINETTFQYKY
jgi:outer membrane murein-binding lipoprotein Lpp